MSARAPGAFAPADVPTGGTRLTAAFTLSAAVAVLMAVQAAWGLLATELYRDVGWIRATWFGNDGVTLVVAVPMLTASLLRARRGSVGALLLWLGLLGYGVYNYAFYLLGTTLNPAFPLYVVLCVTSAVALILGLAGVDAGALAERFADSTPVRLVGGYLVVVAAGLAAVWLAMWAAHVFAGATLPGGTDAFRLVAALDLTLMVPALAFGGVLLWRRHRWGFVIASIASAQGALYLLVLSVNSVVAVRRGFAEPPGELPLWGSLALATAAALLVLLRHLREGRPAPPPA